jgi:hypothetical protein
LIAHQYHRLAKGFFWPDLGIVTTRGSQSININLSFRTLV